jgi:hypothetical protein
VSTWLEAGVPPVQVAKWAGQSIEVLFRVYAKVLSGRESTSGYNRDITGCHKITPWLGHAWSGGDLLR